MSRLLIGKRRTLLRPFAKFLDQTLEKADGTANYANAERIESEDAFSQRVNVLVHSTPFPFAYLARVFRGLNFRFEIHPCVRFSNRPKRNASVGSTNRFSSVEVINPPRITIAIGPSISRPAAP